MGIQKLAKRLAIELSIIEESENQPNDAIINDVVSELSNFDFVLP